MDKHTCPIHGVTLKFKRMHAGGWAELCPTHADTDCHVYWDRRTGRFYNDPSVVAKTYEECKAVPTLDTSSYLVHFDPVTQLYWRHGGCFD